jgi:Uma2 family endonuclease
MSAAPKKKLTEAEYLAVENAAQFKSEFYDGVMYPLHWDGLTNMAGASPGHNLVKENLIVELGSQLKNGPCRTFSSDQRVRLTATGMYSYPDIVIVCGPPEYATEDQNTLINPQVIIEVLSPSTEGYDRRFKFRQYEQQPTIREIVLVAQDEPLVERYVRQGSGDFLRTVFAGPAGEFVLATVPERVPLADVYRGVELPETPPR